MDSHRRRSRYAELREESPEAFINPPSTPIEILLDPTDVSAAEQAAAELLAQSGLPESWAETGVVYEDRHLMVLRDPVRMRSGHLGTYLRLVDSGDVSGVAVLPRVAENIALIRNFRHSTRCWHLEIPRGFGAPGVAPEDAAHRELQEELGNAPHTLVSLGVLHPDTGLNAAAVHLFYAELDSIPAIGAANTDIAEISFVSGAELGGLIRDGEVSDSFTIAAYTRAVLNRLLDSAPPEQPQ